MKFNTIRVTLIVSLATFFLGPGWIWQFIRNYRDRDQVYLTSAVANQSRMTCESLEITGSKVIDRDFSYKTDADTSIVTAHIALRVDVRMRVKNASERDVVHPVWFAIRDDTMAPVIRHWLQNDSDVERLRAALQRISGAERISLAPGECAELSLHMELPYEALRTSYSFHVCSVYKNQLGHLYDTYRQFDIDCLVFADQILRDSAKEPEQARILFRRKTGPPSTTASDIYIYRRSEADQALSNLKQLSVEL